MSEYATWFASLTGHEPHQWQIELASDAACTDRLIRIPTGFGKTLGILGAWIHHRPMQPDGTWPRRLIWCLPMRVLVEQTEQVVRDALARMGLLWENGSDHVGRIGVHVLMGGVDSDDWHLHPEHCSVLIGTQDMLLSRALNRGYAASRARWPMEFGLLNHDALWVMDEVQLMDVGLATSAQLQAFRAQDRVNALRPCATWWMSATMQPAWLESVDSQGLISTAPRTVIPAALRTGHLWDDVHKPCHIQTAVGSKAIAVHAASAAREHGRGKLTLVVVNTVKSACEVHRLLVKELHCDVDETHIHLVHSRFRPKERAAWRKDFLSRDLPMPPSGRIIVATQVIEAGVDLDASVLLTELAPWTSLVQRFGRAARNGGRSEITILDAEPADDRAARPYTKGDLDAARAMLAGIPEVSPKSLEIAEEALDDAGRSRLYPYDPAHLLLRHEWDELFDTTADLTGADIDISRFIRNVEERDVQIFWDDVADGERPDDQRRPPHAALCAAPFMGVQDWLFGKGNKLLSGKRAWIWDWLAGTWHLLAQRREIVPGRLLLVAAASGGYVPRIGWDPSSTAAVPVVPTVLLDAEQKAEESQEGDDLSAFPWKTVGTHGREVEAEALRLADLLGIGHIRGLLGLAGRCHDLGKAHPAFQGSIRGEGRPHRDDLAKAPPGAWEKRLYHSGDGDHRPGFRHELASALGLFALLAQESPDHPALLGPERQAAPASMGVGSTAASPQKRSPTLEALCALSAAEFDLIAYLIACHHGKVRSLLSASPKDQDYKDRDGRGQPIRGVRDGDRLPAVLLDTGPGATSLPSLTLSLDLAQIGLSERLGISWSERAAGLLSAYGPAALAYLEACLRVADVRASRLATSDPLLATETLP